MTTIEIPNRILLPFVIEQLRSIEGKTVTLPLRGRSMRPYLKDGRDKALLIAINPEDVKVGDVVLAEIGDKQYVLHRVIRIANDTVLLRGDGNMVTEQCELSNIHAKTIGFYRKGKEKIERTNGAKWKVYSWIWTRMYPIRRYLLFLFHPHVPAFFKRTCLKNQTNGSNDS